MIKRADLIEVVRAGVVALVLAVVPLGVYVSAQTGNTSGAATRSADARDAGDDNDYGWLNWLGLLGLLGLLPRKPEDVHVRNTERDEARR